MGKFVGCVFACFIIMISGPLKAKTLRVAAFGDDVPGITSLDKGFDPDSYSVIAQIFDSLVAIDLKGKLVQGLSTSWKRIDPKTYEFELRKNVRFHNGEAFTAECVKFTYETVINPENKTGNAWILSSIAGVDVLDPHTVRIHLHHPDGMFLYRLSMFGSIAPVGYIKEKGMAGFLANPVGTGPFSFAGWDRGKEIVLKKNPDYWEKGIPMYDELIFKIIPEDRWVDALKKDRVDVVTRIPPDRIKDVMSDGRFKTMQQTVLQGYWIMLRNKGPLADINVRKAVNHAVNKENLIRIQNGGIGTPLKSLGKRGEIGRNPGLKGYAYNPVTARILLEKAGYKEGFKLKAITIKDAEPLSNAVKEDLLKIGIDLELEVVSRSEWARKVILGKMAGRPYDVDMAITLADNPIVNLAFHAGLFLTSGGPWSLMNDPRFDKLFREALSRSPERAHISALQELDKYIHDQAMMLFTFQPRQVFAMKKDIMIPGVGISGHVDYFVFSHAR